MKTIIPIDWSEKEPQHFIQINSFGVEKNFPYSHSILREKGRIDHLLLYVSQGWIEVEICGEMQQVCAGQCAYIAPHDRHYYCFPLESHSRNYWMHFGGTVIDEVLSSLGITGSCVVSAHSRTSFEHILKRLAGICALDNPSLIPEQNSLLLQMLTLLNTRLAPELVNNENIYTISSYICEHYAEPLTTEDMARIACLSPSRFSHLFTRVIGCSPYHFLQKTRIDKAKYYLTMTSIPIQDIASMVGFNDPMYFSRIFSRYAGCSPREYRQAAIAH